MSKKMLINATLPEEDRVAIVDNGVLTELDIEIAGRQQTKSNIYIGEVVRVEQGLQAAFVDYGASRPGFLQIGEIHPSLYPPQDDESQPSRRPPINQILKRGQQILVQVVKEERGNKGAALTTEISLPGRYMVLMPESNSRGISRKIDSESIRKGIKKAIAELELPDNMGYIIRTAAIDQPPEELKRDFDYLLSTYNSIISHSKTAKAPSLIYQESNLVIRSIRDYFSPEIDEVLIDDRKVFQEARDFFKAVMPEYSALVKLHQERRPIFARYQIEEQIAQLSSNTVNLPSGGSIVLDQTEALVAIDVNSGKMASEKDVEATAYRVNLEAATEVARQLRLRDMGGLIVIDFIDMRQRKNARDVEKTLKTALKIDKARVTVGRISHQFGLLEMSRQRIKANLGEGAYHQCPHCQGSGRVKGAESRSIALLRRIQAGTAKGNIDVVNCTAALDVANYILNNKRVELLDIEQRYNLRISINADQSFLPEQMELEFIKQNKGQQTANDTQTPLVDIDLSERGQQNEEEDTPASAAETESTETGATTSSDESNNDQAAPTEKKRPRRRRRPNRRRNEQNNTEAQPDSSSQDNSVANNGEERPSPDETAAATTETHEDSVARKEHVEPPASESSEKVKKPARRRRSPAKKSAEKTETTSVEGEGKTAAAIDIDTTKPQEPASKTTVETATQATPPNSTENNESTLAPDAKKPVRRRRTTKKVLEEGAVEDTMAKGEERSPSKVESSTEEAEKKPVRRRRTEKKPTTTQNKTETTTATETEPAETTEKPKKRPTTRKRTTTKAKEVEAPAESKSETNAATEAPDKDEKKPVRRRRTVKKPATTQNKTETTIATETEAAEATDKPKKRPSTRKRTTTKAKEVEAPSESKNETNATAEAPDKDEKKPVRRRRTVKKSGTEESVKNPEKTPRKRSTTKKQESKTAAEEK